ncbi:D-2-hydroxyacid dehydrogenase [Labrenzia sp. 011]|uniref:D-2-hydroxyacid dehydrogenase n=1 Tax=Labrenzia sp. 011 TaxID=2171494 RepID=UPI000D51C902|nr:D-2-hydroxyacid dehydrogenase [Labrenzia sp. 011]PVB60415.1 D-2-hydroxyacid dehydrogenase [Labrenzia sp. 011]
MSARIAVCLDLSEDQWVRLQDGVGNYTLEADGELEGCEIAFGNPEADRLEAVETLRWVQLESVGFGEYMGLDWSRLENRLSLTNLAGFFSDPVAETALAGILGLTRGIDRVVQLKSAKSWMGDTLRTCLRSIRNARVVMVGFGAINRRLAQILLPFDCEVMAIHSTTPVQELDDALTGADIVVCTAPDTVATRGLFGRERLALIPAHAIFANLGRGSIVDEDALAEMLNTGRIGGAVLDVTVDEPLPPDHPFWTCPNTILTQHSGGGTTDELDRKIDVFLENLARYRTGQPLQGIVKMTRGY